MTTSTGKFGALVEKSSEQDCRDVDWLLDGLMVHDSLAILTASLSPARLSIIADIIAAQTGRSHPFGQAVPAREVVLLTGMPIAESANPQLEVAGADRNLVWAATLNPPFNIERDMDEFAKWMRHPDRVNVGLIVIDGFTWDCPPGKLVKTIARTKDIVKELGCSMLLVTEPVTGKSKNPISRLPAAALKQATSFMAILEPQDKQDDDEQVYSLAYVGHIGEPGRSLRFVLELAASNRGVDAHKVIWMGDNSVEDQAQAQSKQQQFESLILQRLQAGHVTSSEFLEVAASMKISEHTAERALQNLRTRRKLIELATFTGESGKQYYAWQLVRRGSHASKDLSPKFSFTARSSILRPLELRSSAPAHHEHGQVRKAGLLDAPPHIGERGERGERGEPGEPGEPRNLGTPVVASELSIAAADELTQPTHPPPLQFGPEDMQQFAEAFGDFPYRGTDSAVEDPLVSVLYQLCLAQLNKMPPQTEAGAPLEVIDQICEALIWDWDTRATYVSYLENCDWVPKRTE